MYFFEKRSSKTRKTIDALLALMRVLVRHNFEVIVVLPEYLLKPYVIRHGWEQLEVEWLQ